MILRGGYCSLQRSRFDYLILRYALGFQRLAATFNVNTESEIDLDFRPRSTLAIGSPVPILF